MHEMNSIPDPSAIEDGEDFLDELIRVRTLRNAGFPSLVEAASARRALLGALAEARAEAGLTQTQAAALMGTSQSQVARLESGGADTKLSTVERLAATLGKRIEWRLVDAQ
jgi:DNA-binding XRE family transcriptional regulator